MHLPSSRLTLAATDLGRFLACRHLTGLDVDVAFGKRKKPPKYDDPFLDLLIARGFAHEKEFLEKVKAEGSAVLDIGGITNPRAREDTLAAMKAGHPAISQALLGEGDWYGYADVLRRIDTPDRPSSLGSFSYEAIDTKLSRETRGSTILQLSFYSDILKSIQGIQPEFFHVVTPIASEKYRVADFAAYYRLVKRRLEEAAASDAEALMAANYPSPSTTATSAAGGSSATRAAGATTTSPSSPASHASTAASSSRMTSRRSSASATSSSPSPSSRPSARRSRSRGRRARPASSSRGAAPTRPSTSSCPSKRAAASPACLRPRPATSSSTSKATTSPPKARASTSSE